MRELAVGQSGQKRGTVAPAGCGRLVREQGFDQELRVGGKGDMAVARLAVAEHDDNEYAAATLHAAIAERKNDHGRARHSFTSFDAHRNGIDNPKCDAAAAEFSWRSMQQMFRDIF